MSPLDPSFGLYFPDGSQHTWLADPSLYTESQNGVSLVSWPSGIVNNTSSGQVGP